MSAERACVVAVEIDGRQQYLLETDKLQEMLGASQIMKNSVAKAGGFFLDSLQLHLFQPVSGEIRAWAPAHRRTDLLNRTWELRKWLTELGVEHTTACVEVDRRHFERPGSIVPVDAPLDVDPHEASLSWVYRKLTHEVNRRKQAKSGVDARPVCSLFAPCGLHGHDFANQWRPDKDANEPRRRLRSDRAAVKVKAWKKVRDAIYQGLLLQPVWEQVHGLTGESVDVVRPIQFRDLSDREEDPEVGAGDQYIAFLRADGDQLGTLLSEINWNDPAWSDSRDPWQRARDFAKQLDEATAAAFTEAVVRVTITPPKADRLLTQARAGQTDPVLDVPVLPQLMGGDDLWAVADRRVALPLACTFVEEFDRRVGTELRSAVAIANASRIGHKLTPTMSVGIAFAKAGYPAHAMADAAEALLRSAKALRRSDRIKSSPQGCLDWHWIESSLVEGVDAARRRGTEYIDPVRGAVMCLTTRPWSAKQCRGFLETCAAFDRISRRKREQLDDVLRRGFELSRLAWEGWWKSLLPKEREAIRECESTLKSLGCGAGVTEPDHFNPWSDEEAQDGESVRRTPWLDLLGLQDVQRAVNDPDSSESQEANRDARA